MELRLAQWRISGIDEVAIAGWVETRFARVVKPSAPANNQYGLAKRRRRFYGTTTIKVSRITQHWRVNIAMHTEYRFWIIALIALGNSNVSIDIKVHGSSRPREAGKLWRMFSSSGSEVR